jgi:simple sugar transport system ATP-binding protein
MEGDVLGLAGLLGSGRTEMARLLFGIDSPDQGDVAINGKKAAISSPRNAMMAGLGFCSEDRKNEGIFAELSIRENIILALQARRGVFRYLTPKKQLVIADEMIKSLGIKTPSAKNAASQLSGGNQQKVLLAKWLATEPRVLILDEPTIGIDVGTKYEIRRLIRGIAEGGVGVILVTSEIEELEKLCDRVLVLFRGKIVASLAAGEITKEKIFTASIGGS